MTYLDSLKRNRLWLLLFFFVAFQSDLFAQQASSSSNQNKDTKNWNFVAAPYLLFASMNGEVTIQNRPIEVDAGFGDIADNLNFALMLYFEAYNDQWMFSFDGIYMNLGMDGQTPITGRLAEMEMKQLALDFKGMYRISEWFEAGIGFRINDLNAKANIAEGDIILPGNEIEQGATWFDPLIAARARTDFDGSNWKLQLLGDIGGFGIGSDFTWQIKPTLGYRFSKLFGLDLSYRWISMDYKKGSGSNYFNYDMVISGPELGLMFNF